MNARWISRATPAPTPDLSRIATGDIVALRLPTARATWDAMHALPRGAAFPLSPRDPDARIATLLRNAGARFLWNQDGLQRTEVAEPAFVPTAKLVLHTSGTTGVPKCIVHTEEALSNAVATQAAFLALRASDRWLLALSLHHVGGLGIAARMAHVGGTIVDGYGSDMSQALAEHAPTHVSLVPTQLRRLLRDPDAVARLAACRAVLLGGGPAPALLRQEALGAGIPLVATYGMTETLAFAAASDDPEVVAQEDTGGRALPMRTITSDADGVLCIDSPILFAGTLAGGAFTPRSEGPYRTGDIGTVSEDGVVRIRGRVDRMFVSGGENVHPEEIERALQALPDVAAAIVVAGEHSDFGRCGVAFVAGDVSPIVLDPLLRATLPGFKVPRLWFALPDDTRSPAELARRLAEAPKDLRPLV